MKRTTGATGGPKSLTAFALLCQQSANGAGRRRGVDARFTLAALTLAFGPSAIWTPVPSDARHHRLWSLSALVTAARDGARGHSLNRTIQRPMKTPVPARRLAFPSAFQGSRA